MVGLQNDFANLGSGCSKQSDDRSVSFYSNDSLEGRFDLESKEEFVRSGEFDPTSLASLNSYGIFRIDCDRKHYHGWKVHITRQNKFYHQSFCDKKCGGKANSFAEAKSYRDLILRNVPLMSKAEYVSIVRKNNTSGVAGVFRTETKSGGRGDKVHKYWGALLLTKSGKIKRKKFSIGRYGDRVAFEMACAARIESLYEVENMPHLNSYRHFQLLQHSQ